MPIRVRCPECKTELEVPPGMRPTCPKCGFAGRSAAAKATSPPAADAWASAPPAAASPAASPPAAAAVKFTRTTPQAKAQGEVTFTRTQPAAPAQEQADAWGAAEGAEGDVQWGEAEPEASWEPAPEGDTPPPGWPSAEPAEAPKKRGLFGRRR